MATPLAISPQQRADVALIGKIPQAALKNIAADLRARSQPLIQASKLKDILAKHIKEPESNAALWRLLVYVSTVSERGNETPQGLVDTFLASLEKESRVTPEDRDRFLSIASDIKQVVAHDSVRLVSKAINLSYDMSNTLADARIITDIRPVFDDNREVILGAVITQTLRLDYFRQNSFETISIALDSDDLKQIHDTCASAIQKAAAARKFAREKIGDAVFVTGEEDYGTD